MTEEARRNRRPSERRPLERSWFGRVKRFTRSAGTGSDCFLFGFAAIELADDIGANARERLLVGLAFAVSAFVRGADEAALDEHVRTFLDRRRDVLGEPRAEHANAIPLGLRVPSNDCAGGSLERTRRVDFIAGSQAADWPHPEQKGRRSALDAQKALRTARLLFLFLLNFFSSTSRQPKDGLIRVARHKMTNTLPYLLTATF